MPPKTVIKSYLITDSEYYTHDIETFCTKLEAVLRHHQPDFALYRDKNFTHYADFAPRFIALCHQYGVKPLLHNEAALAVQLNAFGVHYSSDHLCRIGTHPSQLFQILSTHKKEEIVFAQNLGLDAVTFSPIFESPGKGTPVGLDVLKQISGTMGLPIIALGGILQKSQISAVEAAGAWAFASIRYFYLKDM